MNRNHDECDASCPLERVPRKNCVSPEKHSDWANPAWLQNWASLSQASLSQTSLSRKNPFRMSPFKAVLAQKRRVVDFRAVVFGFLFSGTPGFAAFSNVIEAEEQITYFLLSGEGILLGLFAVWVIYVCFIMKHPKPRNLKE